MSSEPKRTHLYEWHKAHGDVIDFAGWLMPVRYTDIREEHMAVRDSVGIFDTTHMFRFLVEGPQAVEFLQTLTSNNVRKLKEHMGHYTTCLNEHGGIHDDLMLYHIEDDKFIWVTNAGNGPKIWNHMKQHASDFEVHISDLSRDIVMIAVQGPKSLAMMSQIAGTDISALPRLSITKMDLLGSTCYLCRTGYTGEAGVEILLLDTPFNDAGIKKAISFWEGLLSAGAEFGVKPCGLGARDSTRLEAGFVLYGNELDENTSPIEARVPYAVKFKVDPHYIGYDVVLRHKKEGVTKTRIGFVMIDRGIPRHGYDILINDEKVGVVTSGGLSPILQKGIGMGYIKPDLVSDGDVIQIDLKGRIRRAEVKTWPFYDPDRYGATRKSE
ncbi:MAG: glycine cleavage system aminomethyltransferase GcvT [Candidatus Thorarchaeota archaeon]|nr:glycine cleavage system aminomethyltransferase GcvT [Candidatus Thorarchaeota archaeon]